MQRCRYAGTEVLRYRGVEVQRCRVQRCRGAMVVQRRCRGAEVQRCRCRCRCRCRSRGRCMQSGCRHAEELMCRGCAEQVQVQNRCRVGAEFQRCRYGGA